MGEIIRSNAAVDDILKDVRKTVTNAGVQQGLAAEQANLLLAPILAVVTALEAQQEAAQEALVPLAAAVKQANSDADAEIRHIYDDVWNDVGRPQQDAYLSLLFPGGTAFYTDGETSTQPQRMEILAKLFDQKLHPKLTADQCASFAQRVRAEKDALHAAVSAAIDPAALVEQLDRVHTALGRVAQFALGNYKRALKIGGFTEKQIHDIIPDRPSEKKDKKSEKKANPADPPADPK